MLPTTLPAIFCKCEWYFNAGVEECTRGTTLKHPTGAYDNTLSLSLFFQNITCRAHARLTPLRPYKLMQLILVRAFKSRPRKPIGNHEELFCLATLLSASLRGWEIISFVLRGSSIFLFSLSSLFLFDDFWLSKPLTRSDVLSTFPRDTCV